jgi:hypothetical protein
MRSPCLLLLLTPLLLGEGQAFRPLGAPQKCHISTPALSRRSFVQDALLVASTTVLLPTAAARASDGLILGPVEALRSVELCQKKLLSNSVELFVATDDYLSFMSSLRTAPLSDLRKSCSVLIQFYQGDTELLVKNYKKMISGLERMDSLALAASRGRVLGGNEFEKSYFDMLQALAEFVQAVDGTTAKSV